MRSHSSQLQIKALKYRSLALQSVSVLCAYSTNKGQHKSRLQLDGGLHAKETFDEDKELILPKHTS